MNKYIVIAVLIILGVGFAYSQMKSNILNDIVIKTKDQVITNHKKREKIDDKNEKLDRFGICTALGGLYSDCK